MAMNSEDKNPAMVCCTFKIQKPHTKGNTTTNAYNKWVRINNVLCWHKCGKPYK